MSDSASDIQLFRRVATLSALLSAFVVGIGALAIRYDGSDHALGLVTRLCNAALQMIGGVSALLLLSLPALLALSVIGHGWYIMHRTRSVTRRLLLASETVPQRLALAAADAGIAGRVELVRCGQPEVFVHGLRRPRVLITTGGLDALTDAELAAVMQHEAHHVQRRDPLRLTFVHAMGRALFLFPLVADLGRQLATATELEADRRAIHNAGRIQLASALTRFLGGDRLAAAPGVSLHHTDELRLAQLRKPHRFGHTFEARRASRVISTATGCMLVALLIILAFVPDMHFG